MLLFFLFNSVSYSQNNIQGFVKDSISGTPLQNVNILIKSNVGILIDYALTNTQGFYKKIF
jgi:hypothetical protein